MSLLQRNFRLLNQARSVNLLKNFHTRSILLNEEKLTDGEQLIFNKLTQNLKPSELFVKDVSGGCGSMYAIKVKSGEFKGKGLVQQHRIVNEILKDEIKDMHGLQLDTSAE
ncbi:bola-like protein [Conidiobolus coronatus NRRL 28638]|uniref:Bola-like protein n=1 Tax=Conidiobolus coronatus (strain ATCC 28846 / CBS 209.66 / NRRL 28638) TaxID=796925 RepID=A0A137PF92_CONC2|nr:bola-like protein [Conidiobolus coronatus NRRL 28638]|eukprot:KXN73667.1 bola-like protein [Conidiobolus coronatus NRRL 28638]